MKPIYLGLILVLLLTACSQVPEQESLGTIADLDNLGPAPELTNTTWINTDQELRLGDLRGQVVLLDMWTFG